MNSFSDNLDSIKRHAVEIGMSVVFLLILINFAISSYSKTELNNRNEFVANRLEVNSRLSELDRSVNLMDLGFRGYYMINKDGFKDPYMTALDIYGANLDTLKQVLGKLNYHPLDSIDYIKSKVGDYAALVGQGMEFIELGQPEKAVELFVNDPGYDLWRNYSPVQANIRNFVSDQEILNKERYQSIGRNSFYIQLLSVLLGLPTLIFVFIRLRRNDTKLSSLFEDLDKSNQELIYNEGHSEATALDGQQVISKIIQNLKNTSTFIKDITKGNLNVAWNGMDEKTDNLNKDTLVGELISMRDQMKAVKADEEIRYWVAEGISKFSEIVRDDQSGLKGLGEKIVSEVVTYTNSLQGALFLLNEDNADDRFLELVSAYAYDRKKFLERRADIGVGMVGQVYLEGLTTRLSDVPQHYLSITSGLGHALPENLLLVPIKVNDNIQGILELASFNDYEDHVIEFLEKVCEIVASAVINTKTAMQTKQLLEQSQENTEEMRSQEEEMRQNMEELQATQEEQERLRTELEEKIDLLESELAKKNHEYSAK
ncbi:MAG: GAF domain-containing protein [Bacteroidota bacterium]